MKKLFCFLLAAMLLLTAGLACAEATEEPARTLIVYFAVADNSEVDAVSSASVVTWNDDAPMGKVAVLAHMIHNQIGGDIFSLDVDAVYPANIMDLLDFAQEEQDENARPAILNPIESIDQYNTIFVGYPLWWYDLPMVTYSLFDAYDFSGKTIIPFCTHNGSRFSGTIGTIEELEPEATVIREGFTVSEWDILEAEEDVKTWLKELGY